MSTFGRNLTDYVPAATLQRVVGSFAALTGYAAEVRDAEGNVLADSGESAGGDAAAAVLGGRLADGDDPLPVTAPIEVDGEPVGVMELLGPAGDGERIGVAAATGERGVMIGPTDDGEDDGDGEPDRMPARLGGDAGAAAPPADLARALHCLHTLAETLSLMCRQGLSLRHRVEELSTLFELSTLLGGERDLHVVLDTVVRSVTDLMGVKAAAIRLLDGDRQELRVEAVHNLSDQYLSKGPILLARSELDRRALGGEVIYVPDMSDDPRTLYPEDAKREGLTSILIAGLIYRGKPIGTMRVYTGGVQPFSENRRNLLRAIAQLAAVAIRNTQLDAERARGREVRRQLELAADVQRRLLPASDPECCPPFDIASHYEPSFELGGDFYDFIPLGTSIGIVMGDVVGKGIAASLLMASVRASLRAHAESLYDIDEVMAHVNTALVGDTRDHEFATVFYGTLDRPASRLTYCSAGHEPALLLRDGRFTELREGGMALGVDPRQTYDKALLELRRGDMLLLYTDGVTEAMSFDGEMFGRQRIRQAMLDTAGGTARDLVNHVVWQLRRFVGLNHRPDDVTLVAIRHE